MVQNKYPANGWLWISFPEERSQRLKEQSLLEVMTTSLIISSATNPIADPRGFRMVFIRFPVNMMRWAQPISLYLNTELIFEYYLYSNTIYSPYSVFQTLKVPSSEADTTLYVPGNQTTLLTIFVCEGTPTLISASKTVEYTSGDGIVAHKIISVIACTPLPC